MKNTLSKSVDTVEFYYFIVVVILTIVYVVAIVTSEDFFFIKFKSLVVLGICIGISTALSVENYRVSKENDPEFLNIFPWNYLRSVAVGVIALFLSYCSADFLFQLIGFLFK